MGHHDLYPFQLPEPVQRKIAYVHRLVTERAAAERAA
jgi:hypothetical protein